MALTQGNGLGPYDFGDPKSPTYPIAAEQRAAARDQERQMTQTATPFMPGDRVHYDPDRDTYWPRGDDEAPGWGTVVDEEQVPRPLRTHIGARTPVEWDVPLDGEDGPDPITMPITACLVTATAAPEADPTAPPVVCICGSTRFRSEMAEANLWLTLDGNIVVAPGVFMHDGDAITDKQKTALDRLHFRKIDLAQSIYVVNPDGYIGESTQREIAYAERTGKPVAYLEQPESQGVQR